MISDFQFHDESIKSALVEITNALNYTCKTLKLPLAQTWIICNQLTECITAIDSASYIGDASLLRFHKECCDQHLLKTQGVVGRAFEANQTCFTPDITAYSKTEYPLSHLAIMYGLRAAVAVPVRSVYTASTDFILEFFLPMDSEDKQKRVLESLYDVLGRCLRTFYILEDKNLDTELIPGKQGEVSSSSRLSDDETSVKRSRKDRTSCDLSESWKKGGTNSRDDDNKQTKNEKNINLNVLRQHFAGSLKDAAKNIGGNNVLSQKLY